MKHVKHMNKRQYRAYKKAYKDYANYIATSDEHPAWWGKYIDY